MEDTADNEYGFSKLLV